MGMSASQARLLSLTARMHDMEFQAQALQYTKLDLINSKDAVYNEYLDAMDSTKLQMAVVTPTGKQFQDITYTNMVMSNAGAAHSMYIITNMRTGQILLPEQVASKLGDDPNNRDPLKSSINPYKDDGVTLKTDEEKLEEYLIKVARERVFPNGKNDNGEDLTTDEQYLSELRAKEDGKVAEYWTNRYYSAFPETEEDFMLVVAKNYLYTGRTDLESTSDYLNEMRKDGNYDYWKAVYYQIIGYQDADGVLIPGKGFCPISAENASDRDWLQDALNSGEVLLYKLTNEISLSSFGDKINIFAKTSVATDTELAEAANDEIIRQAEVKYEKAMKDIDEKETKLDLKLAQIDTQHNALKTEYDSVKQIVSKNIDRSFKTFNA